MRKMADGLDQLAADIAGHYREKASGTDAQWRKAMKPRPGTELRKPSTPASPTPFSA